MRTQTWRRGRSHARPPAVSASWPALAAQQGAAARLVPGSLFFEPGLASGCALRRKVELACMRWVRLRVGARLPPETHQVLHLPHIGFTLVVSVHKQMSWSSSGSFARCTA
jgi:hypothetical protein